MELSELLPAIRSLPREDKLRLIQLVAAEVAHEEGDGADRSVKTVPLWSPHESFEGAASLLRLLDEDTARQDGAA